MANDDGDNYEVGYGRPPKHARFKKGQSGNPRGRRKRSKNLETLVQQELDTAITVKEGGCEKRITKREAIVMRIVNGALAGHPRQLEFLFKLATKTGIPDPFDITSDDEAELVKAIEKYLVQQSTTEGAEMVMSKAELTKALYRNDLCAFVRFAFRELHPDKALCDNWHIDVMADYLARCLNGEDRRLIINVPPRSLKSLCASIALATFALGRNPRLKIMSLAGNRELASEIHQMTRRLMRSQRCRALFPHLVFDNSLPEIRLPHGGGLIPGVFGRSLIGRGADLVIIDDPQSPTEAKDERSRKAVNDWLDAEVLPRLTDKGTAIVILVMQRLHPDDLSGHVLTGNQNWTVVRLPAVALANERWSLSNGTVYRRNKGEVLCPGRKSRDDLIGQLHQVGAGNFYAQYLQSPRKSGEYRTGLFRYPVPPDWKPGMSRGGFLGRVPEAGYILYEVFGVGERPLYPCIDSGLTLEQWEQGAKQQQQRLLAMHNR